MIKITNVETCGWEAAIRGMRNPKNSWDKSDSDYKWSPCVNHGECKPYFLVGENDLKLMKSLSKAGNDHGKFLRMINVTLDITAPLYWWKEFDTYKVGTVANSCSTMHKIHAKEFTLDDFSHEHLRQDREAANPYVRGCSVVTPLGIMVAVISELNFCRRKYLETEDKQWWWQMIQLLPSSYNQKRTVQLNYQVLKSMYHARKHHKLDEWRDFCSWIETLPYSEIITGGIESCLKSE